MSFRNHLSRNVPGTLNTARDKMGVSITRVRASEAAQLSGFSSRCFDQTYGPLCRAADVDAHIAEFLSASAWLTVLTGATSWVLAAVIDDQWAAYSHLQLAALPEGTASMHASAPSVTPVEICRFYIARKWHGQGVAAALLSEVFTHAAAHGAESVWLSSWQENARANAFYAKWGFGKIGTTTFVMGEDVQQDFLLQRVLPSSQVQTGR
jgi:GNAT superfamily N-acetyltransferase